MKKVPSYPKITAKTNITFTQTQNININSPKSLAISTNALSPKNMFKAVSPNNNTSTNKLNRDKQKSNNSYLVQQNNIYSQKSKSKILSQKGSKSSTQLHLKRQSSNANMKMSKNQNHQNSIKKIVSLQGKKQGKQQIKRLQQKLKVLQKKIDTIKSSSSKRKKQASSSQRSKLKRIDNNSGIMQQKKLALQKFQKKKAIIEGAKSSSKILKKSHSDKDLIKRLPPKNPGKINKQAKVEDKNEKQEEVIHKFITQVQKNPKMYQRHHIPQQQMVSKILYYVTNLSLSLKNNDLMIYRQHLIQSLQTFNFMQNVRRPTLKELQKHCVTLQQDSKRRKYTLVLDLDQTLIHCNQTIDTPYDVSLKIKFPTGQKIDAGVNIRPHAWKLLEQLSQICEIIVFTASHECYANVVLDHLDPQKKLISHRLYRNHCWQSQEGIYIKDLRVLKNRNLENVLLVDNAAYSYFFQLQNGIPIIPFYDDKQDQELLHLIKYVRTLIKVKEQHKIYPTIKKANQSYFKLHQYMNFNDLQKLTNILYEAVIKQFQAYHQ